VEVDGIVVSAGENVVTVGAEASDCTGEMSLVSSTGEQPKMTKANRLENK